MFKNIELKNKILLNLQVVSGTKPYGSHWNNLKSE